MNGWEPVTPIAGGHEDVEKCTGPECGALVRRSASDGRGREEHDHAFHDEDKDITQEHARLFHPEQVERAEPNAGPAQRTKAMTYGYGAAVRAEEEGSLVEGDIRLPYFADLHSPEHPMATWDGEQWVDATPYREPAVGDLRGPQESPHMWNGEHWVRIPNPEEDRLLAAVMRRLLDSSGYFDFPTDDQMIVDGSVNVTAEQRALIERLLGRE